MQPAYRVLIKGARDGDRNRVRAGREKRRLRALRTEDRGMLGCIAIPGGQAGLRRSTLRQLIAVPPRRR